MGSWLGDAAMGEPTVVCINLVLSSEAEYELRAILGQQYEFTCQHASIVLIER